MSTPDAPPRRRRRRGGSIAPGVRLLLIVAGVGVAAFALGFLFTAVFLFGGGSGAGVVTVPDLRGRTAEEAQRLLAPHDLSLEVGPALTNPDVPAGQVLAQTPLPGEEISYGSAVRIVLSDGPERRPVPELRSLRRAQAESTLRRSGFEAVFEERIDFAPAGQVIEVSPAPGTELPLPATVRVVVSAGPPREPVPDVFGLGEAEAREVLEGAGFRVGAVSYDFFSPRAAGTVVDQAPAAGTDAPLRSEVGLVVAGAPSGNL